jgi:DNA-binding HxlR family transcriptional regulator
MHTDSEEAALGEAFGPLAVFSPVPTRAVHSRAEPITFHFMTCCPGPCIGLDRTRAGSTYPNNHLHSESDIGNLSRVPGKPKPNHRSGCPVTVSLDIFGDRWSLLVIRDLMVRGYRTFKEFREAGEGIATNVLADRLRKLEAAGIITARTQDSDHRKVNYRLTRKGIDLAPVLLELLIWGARHEETEAPCDLIVKMSRNRKKVLAEVRRRWRKGDLTPVLPEFGKAKLRPEFKGRELRSNDEQSTSTGRHTQRRVRSLVGRKT